MRSHSRELSVAVTIIAACGGTDGPGGPGGGSGPPPAPVATNAVDVADNRFSPPNAIGPSGTVTWTWRGSALHNVTFEDGQGSSATKGTGTHQRTFPGPGTFRYRCTIHSANFESGMTGRVVVN